MTVFSSYEPVERELGARGLTTRRVNLWGDVNPVGLWSLTRLFRDTRPDVLILTKQREYWMGGLVARWTGRPLVVFRLGLKRPLREDAKRRLSFGRFADMVIVNSGAVRDAVVGPSWLDPDKVRVLLNGVDATPVDADRGRASLTEIGAPAGAPVVVAAGRLTNQKGFDVLIRAFAPVVREVPDATLVILGEGGQRRSLTALAESTGCAGSIIFAGHRDDVREIIAGADVYALSSRNEGMANTLLEAMSVGTPIVATDVSGTTEAVRDGEDAVVVPSEDPGALAAAVVGLLRDRERASRLGASAFERVREKFGRDRMFDELEEMLLAGLRAKRTD